MLIDGEDVTELPPHKRGVAMVFQEFLLFPHRTVQENLAFPLRMMKLPQAEIDERIAWVVGILSLGGLEKRYPNQLSGGQQQRVALGRGLVGRPKALLLDEPLANLDRELRQEMEVEIRRHQIALGIPFIYVTHNQEEALSMSDRIAVVRNGRIEDFAPRTEIYDRPKTAFIAQFVGRSNRFEGAMGADGKVADELRGGDGLLAGGHARGQAGFAVREEREDAAHDAGRSAARGAEPHRMHGEGRHPARRLRRLHPRLRGAASCMPAGRAPGAPSPPARRWWRASMPPTSMPSTRPRRSQP